jgi:membrane protein implicated in regulation of membrane protease activity
MKEMMVFWLVLLIVTIVAEVLTLGLTSIWFAGGALAAILAAILHAPIWLQIILFFLVSFLLLFFTRPVAVKYFNKDRVKTNVESMIGRQAVVTGEIDNLQGIGQVTIGGQEWTARSTDNSVRIPVGNIVDVVDVSGVKLIVKVDEQMKRVDPEGQTKQPPEPMSVSQMEAYEDVNEQ